MNVKNCDLMKNKSYHSDILPYCTLFKTFLQFREYENDDRVVHDEFWCQCKICGSSGKLIHIKNARYRSTCKIELEEAEKESILPWNTRT